MPKPERRIRRSKYRSGALGLQLQACAERSGVDAMILADGEGLLVATSPWNEDASERLAARLADVEVHQFRMETVCERGDPPRTVSARGFTVGIDRLVVCAVGCPTSRTVPELYTAMRGIRRILTA